MKKITLILFLMAVIIPASLFAGNFGSIKGKVVDNDGKPVVGASVRIEGTRLGAFVKADGRFIVSNIPPGEYVVKISFVGFPNFEAKVRISADESTELSATMRQGDVMMPEVVKYGDELVKNNDIGVKREFSTKDMVNIGREGIQSIVGLSAGVFNSGNGFIIRGSRSNESQIRIDGVDAGNQFTGGFGLLGSTYYPMVSTFAAEEVQVLTGGFSAKYGNALGGIVNTSLKTGRTDSYEGIVRWRTDVPFLWGSQATGTKLVREDSRLWAVDEGDGLKLQSSNENRYEIVLGGPLPLLDKSTFSISGNFFHEAYRGAGYEIYTPWFYDNEGNLSRTNVGRIAGNESWVKNITGRLKFAISNAIDLTVGGSFGMSNIQSNSWGWLYATTPGAIEGLPSYGIPENKAKQSVFNQQASSIIGIINHRLSSNSFYELKVSNTINNDEASKRSSFEDPSFFGGFELTTPQDAYEVNLSQLLPGRDKMLDQYQNVTAIKRTSDLYYLADLPIVNSTTGYIEGATSSQTGYNPYGIVGAFAAHGNGGLQFRKGNYWQVDGSYNLMIDGEFDHSFEAGFETRFWSIKRHMNGLPWDGNPFFDVYTDEWGGNLYAWDSPNAYERTSKGYSPTSASVYAFDQITYKGIIFTPGIRFDYFNANANYRTILNPFQPVTADSALAPASAKYQLSPRVNVSYPITVRSNVSVSYGLLFMMPQMQYMFDGFAVIQLRGNQNLGNPDLEAQRVNQFQVSYANQLTDDFSVDVAAYYKDIYNQLGISYVSAVPDPYFLYQVADYGSSKGLEITLRKMPTNHFGIVLNYNLSQSVATAADPDANYLVAQDFYTGRPAYPLSPFPTNSDRRHRINAIIDLVWGKGEGPMIGGIGLLENTNINLTTFFQSGLPYTRADRAGNAIGEENAERQPSIWNTNFRFQRRFPLKDWFGDGAGKSSIEFFVDVNNIFNNRSVAGVYARTGDPIDDGVSFYRQLTDYVATTYYAEANYGIPESFSAEQYSYFGERFYNINGDFDRNGNITIDEKRKSNDKYLEDRISGRGNFQAPITVYFGLMFRF
jgi:outer membrane receptor protein involved in Fe transport